MLISIVLVFVIALGGFALTYIFADDEPLLWRIAAGNVIGSAVFGTLLFAASMAAGLGTAVVFGCLAATLIPLLVFRDSNVSAAFDHDLARANGKLRGANLRKLARFSYYALFFLLFVFFFRRAMIETPQGIFTGGSQNLGDLPFHLGAILGFSDGGNFPPQNPSFAGAKFSYPFIADLLTAGLVRLGAGVSDAMFVQNVSWAFSLLVILERFVLKLTGDRLAGRLGPALLFFSGGLGFVAFFSDFGSQSRTIADFLWQLPADYTISDKFRWGNSLVVMFMTQRSLLLGMPLTMIVLGVLWKLFAAAESKPDRRRGSLRIFFVGLVAGLLPLIHLHSLGVLFIVGVFLFILQPRKWMIWLAFAAGVAVAAIPEIIWSVSGSASETAKFVGWHFGWNKGEDESFFWFWLVNTGIFIPMLALGIYLATRSPAPATSPEPSKHVTHKSSLHLTSETSSPDGSHLLLFFVPFAFLFLISNVAKLAPWEWDNIKVLIYWFVGSLPFAAFALSRLWHRGTAGKAAAVVCLVVLIFSGSLDVWRTISSQINYKVFDRDAVGVARKLKTSTAPSSLFLNAPTYNTAVVLTGRLSVMRYTGHLSSHGIDYAEREADVKRIYLGGADAAALLDKYAVDYVMISPEERNAFVVNEPFFAGYPIAAEAGQYRVYKIR